MAGLLAVPQHPHERRPSTPAVGSTNGMLTVIPLHRVPSRAPSIAPPPSIRAPSIRSYHSARSFGRKSWAAKSWQTSDPERIPPPSHRHAAPSAPWPWINISDDVDKAQLNCTGPPIPKPCLHEDCQCWTGYPKSRFPNWTDAQVLKSGIRAAIDMPMEDSYCTIYCCDVDTKGQFIFKEDPGADMILKAYPGKDEETWKKVLDNCSDAKRPKDLRVRALFIDNMSGPILQMLGARFNIEPFFFSSSLNWIPSRFQEEIVQDVGDHITLTLPFIKSMPEEEFLDKQLLVGQPAQSVKASTLLGTQKIDTQKPLVLYSNKRILSLDLISLHLIRNIKGSTIISYHPTVNLPTTEAAYLHERIRFAGQSVYWQHMFRDSPDPTLVLICFIWHALYAWDESLESLYEHIISLENRVITTAHMPLTRELHHIRAHHLHYQSLLDEFVKHITFLGETENPFMTAKNFSKETLKLNKILLARECKNLRHEVDRLKSTLYMQERRLKNVMNLVFSSVNITDSKYMREMTEAAVRDSAAMKQIAYLTMIFLPASFVAGVFGMNITEISSEGKGTLAHYIATAIPLTVFTAWIIVAFQSQYIFANHRDVSFWHRLLWPVVVPYQRFFKKEEEKQPDYENQANQMDKNNDEQDDEGFKFNFEHMDENARQSLRNSHSQRSSFSHH